MWDVNGYIDAALFCCETGRNCSTVVHQKEEEPKEIIRLLQDMASEPEILEFSTADSEWEHELIRDYLVSSRTNDGLLIERYPFGWFHSLNGVVIKERILVLHNRQIRLKFEPQEDTLQIIVDCMETENNLRWNFLNAVGKLKRLAKNLSGGYKNWHGKLHKSS